MSRASGDPTIIRVAQGIVKSVPSRDEDAQAAALLNWTRSKCYYVHDPVGKELVKDPEYMLRELKESGSIASDCDDQVVLLGSLLRAVGIEAEPVVVSPDDGTFTHVLLRYRSPKAGWTTLDPITRNAPGWFPMGVARVGTYSNGRINPNSPVTVQGLSGLPANNIPPNPVTLDDFVKRTSARVEPLNTLMWFGLGLAALWKWHKTGRLV